MKRSEIEGNLRALGQKLAARGVTGEILSVGGYLPARLRSMRTQLTLDAIFEEIGPTSR